MKIGIITTETVHHSYFVRELKKFYEDIEVFCETNTMNKFPFETFNNYEILRDEFEAQQWFNGDSVSLDQITKTHYFPSINDTYAIETVNDFNPDILFVFGTGKIKGELIHTYKNRILNLHGGDPERYRGLDSHLWAVYHMDFEALITTLHMLETELDRGDIVLQAQIPIQKNASIVSLRARNTQICVDLCITAIEMFKRNGLFLSRPQKNIGRYYSAMPATLKNIVITRFQNYTNNL